MYLGKVVGSVWGAKQAPKLEGLKLLQIRPVKLRTHQKKQKVRKITEQECDLSEQVILAADTLGAGPGEYVLVAMGSRVRDIVYDTNMPIKAVVVAIVDSADIDIGEVH